MAAPPAPRRPRMTAHRQAVLELLHRTDHFRSAQQLHFEIREHHTARIGLTTVYRILRTLAEQKIAETQRAEDGEILYRLCANPGHCHYLLCRRCGRAVGFTAADIELHTSQLAEAHRYADVTHHIDLYGTCPLCVAV
jgi:Fur family transcriptional regulator, ferric uptake regulator